MRARTYAVLTSALLAAGCVGTHMTSEVNPEIAGRHFTKLLVLANFADLHYEKLAESRLCSKIIEVSATACIPATSLFMTHQQHTRSEILRVYRKNGIDGAVILSSGRSGTTQTNVPWVVPGQENGSATATCVGSSCTGSYSGSYTPGYVMSVPVSKPYASWQVALYTEPDSAETDSSQNSRLAWVATGSSSGNGFASWDDMTRSVADKTADKLRDAGLLLPAR